MNSHRHDKASFKIQDHEMFINSPEGEWGKSHQDKTKNHSLNLDPYARIVASSIKIESNYPLKE